MRHVIARLGLVAAVMGAVVGLSSPPAFSEAVTIDCSIVQSDLGGTVVFTPNGQLLGNCWEHSMGEPGTGQGGTATIVDCGEALGPDTVGIQVTTPNGGVYTNCHVHIT